MVIGGVLALSTIESACAYGYMRRLDTFWEQSRPTFAILLRRCHNSNGW